MYNLGAFGTELRCIRNQLKLTQSRLSALSGIHVDTLRRIENGKVLPSQATLDLLAVVLKEDLNVLLLEHRLSNSDEFDRIVRRIETALDNGIYVDLQKEVKNLANFLATNDHPYLVKVVQQYLLLIEGILLNKNDEKPHDALDKLTSALKLTIDDFSYENHRELTYNTIELRLLMNIALVINKTVSNERCLEMLETCLNSAEPEDNIYPKICFNLAYTNHRLDRHEKALHYADLGIESCLQKRNYNGLNLLYFRKGIAEYHLGKGAYRKSLKRSIFLCEVLGQKELSEEMTNKCKKLYGIKI